MTLFLVSCSSTKKIDRNALKKVKKVAVIVYTVPSKIEFKEDPRGKKDSGFSLNDVVKAIAKDATAGEGSRAADLALKEFIHTANKEGLPFKIVSYKTMKKIKGSLS